MTAGEGGGFGTELAVTTFGVITSLARSMYAIRMYGGVCWNLQWRQTGVGRLLGKHVHPGSVR
jgi:hypothetical protein